MRSRDSTESAPRVEPPAVDRSAQVASPSQLGSGAAHGDAPGKNRFRLRPLRLSAYTAGVRAGWPDSDIERAIVCGLPRRFHATSSAIQRRLLQERVPLTRTRWDALLAAMVEHLALIHGHRVPEWADEPERFLDIPWVLPSNPTGRRNALLYAPAPFLRHGAIPDPQGDSFLRGQS
ncbi:MAG: hypothetical protein OXN89_15645 [Bryobacterales bacterium]|nr:hypothetical protein [Bryobacterales bacterium]